MQGGCDNGYCDSEVIYGAPEPTMGMPYGNYAYKERYHQTKHKVSWTQKFKSGWNKRFGKKPCDCAKCRAKRRHHHNGEIHADDCPCDACRYGEEYEVYDGGEYYEGEYHDGEVMDGDVIYDDGMSSYHPSSGQPACKNCQQHGQGQVVYDQQYAEGEVIDGDVYEGEVYEGEVIDDGMTQSYPEYGGRHFAPPVPHMEKAAPGDSSGATLNGEIMDDVPATEVPTRTFEKRVAPGTESAPNSAMPYENESEFSAPRPMPDDNISLKPVKNYREALMLPPTWDEVHGDKPEVTQSPTPRVASAEAPEWVESSNPPSGSTNAVYSKPSARPYYKPAGSGKEFVESYKKASSTQSVSHEQPVLLPPEPQPRRLRSSGVN